MNTAEFTSKYYIDRRGSHSRKWDGQHLKFSRTDLLPLWVADMDFMPPQCIQNAICNYVKANPLGYTIINPNYIDAVISWYKRRHHCNLQEDWLTSAPQCHYRYYVVYWGFHKTKRFHRRSKSCIRRLWYERQRCTTSHHRSSDETERR